MHGEQGLERSSHVHIVRKEALDVSLKTCRANGGISVEGVIAKTKAGSTYPTTHLPGHKATP